MTLQESISKNPIQFQELCREHDVKYLYAFGSSVNGDFNDISSDIDLMIEIENNDPIQSGEQLMNIWDKFELFFQKKVDLVTTRSIKNPVLKASIESSKLLIYDGKELKISY
jgi:predicted nucleotidyltransferase